MKPVESPCTDRCGHDERFGWCKGCFRTPEEIRTWPRANDAARRKIIKSCFQRKAVYKQHVRRERNS